MNDKNSLGRNAVYKVILNIFNLLIPLFVGPYIAGLLDKNLYGIYNRVYAEFQIFFICGAFGIYNYGVREISRVRHNEEKLRKIFSSLFVIGVISNLVVTVVYIIYFVVRGTGIDKYVYATMIIQMVSNIFYIEFVNEAVENYSFITKKTIIVRSIYFAAIFLFVRKPTDVIIYSVVVSMTVLLNNVISFCYLKRNIKFDFYNIKIKPYIFPLVVSLILVNVELLYSQLDKILLGAFVNDIAVTEYTLPTTLVGMIGTIPLSLINVAIPRLSSYVGKEEKEAYIETLHNTTRVYMAILAPMVFGIFVLAKEIMWLYSGDVYTYVYPVLAIAALSRIVYGYDSKLSNLVMYVNGLEKELTIFLFGGGVINVILNGILIISGNFSAKNALITTMLSIILFVIVGARYSEKRLKIKLKFFSWEILRYFVVSFLFIPITYAVKVLNYGYWFNILVSITLCVTVYGIFMLITKDPLVQIIANKIMRKSE